MGVGPFRKILHAHDQRFPPSSTSLDPVVVFDSSRKQVLSFLSSLTFVVFLLLLIILVTG